MRGSSERPEETASPESGGVEPGTGPGAKAGERGAGQPGRAGKILGVILAGGRSRRFGGEKALFPLGGRPMAEWALLALKPNTARQVVISHLPEVARALGVPGLQDHIPGRGPLGGIHAGLTWAREGGFGGAFVLACDLPLVGPGLVGRILQAWPSVAPAAVPESPGPLGLEPLCGVYGVECLAGVEEAALSSHRSMEDAIRRLGAFTIPMPVLGGREAVAAAFTNVNTRTSAEWVRELLEGGVAGAPADQGPSGSRDGPGPGPSMGNSTRGGEER